MPSFKAKFLSACTWALPVLSAVVPHSLSRREEVHPAGKLLNLDVREQYAQATFSVPCAGCLGEEHTSHDDESIILSFRTHAEDSNCGTSNITLNGVHLPQEWNGDFASGSASYTGVTDFEQDALYLQHDLELEWESACLRGDSNGNNDAQVLTVNIKAIDGRPVANLSGFTISYRQQSPPELLRLEATPNRSASNRENSESWRAPPAHLRLVLTSAEEAPESDLETLLRDLKDLQAEVKRLQAAIAEKEKKIKAQLKQPANTFKEQLHQCDNVTCVFKTVATGAQTALRVVYIHFRPQQSPTSSSMGSPEKNPFQEGYRAGYKQLTEAKIKSGSDATISHAPLPTRSVAPQASVMPTASPSSLPSSSSEQDGDHQEPPRKPSADPRLIIALEIVLGLLCCGCLAAVIRHSCSSPRTRAERAAAREERRNARAYRRAARKLAWHNWWRGNRRDQQRIEDYEEKRSLIQHQESILEDAMQEEIRQLRAAHSVVNDIVQAEEGRVASYSRHVHCHCAEPIPQAPYSPLSTASTYPPTSIPEMPSRPLSRTDSLPGYRSDASTAPPEYETDEDVSDVVANGFRNYAHSTASETSSRWTPDSSIVDVSPRPSAETLRHPYGTEYAETTDTGVGDKS